MFGIGDYFSKIKNSFTQELFIRKAICDAIKEVTGADIPIEGVKFKSGTVNVSGVSSELKSTIFIKKRAILEKIGQKQNIRTVNDIR